MYYTIESEGWLEFSLFRRYNDACLAAWELARRTPHEVRVVRLETRGGFGRQILCVYNCKCAVPTNRLANQVWKEED